MIQERDKSKAEYALAQIIKNPVLFREFINIDDPLWQELEPHERAWTSSKAQYLSMCCGRGVRKTTTVIEMLYYWALNGMFIPGDPGLLMYVPNKAQKDAIFPRIREACEKHWLIAKFVDMNSINVAEGRIKFLNGFTYILRIAGSEGKESNVISLHTARMWIDEAQDFPWKAWLSLDNVLKFDVPGYMKWVSGVPNGERRENVLFNCDQENDRYSRYNVPQTAMSWWSPELEYERRVTYKALQEDSEDYKHFVLGQHGVPTFAVFDRQRFLKEDYEVLKVVLTQPMFERSRRIDARDGTDKYHLEDVIVCPDVPAGNPGVKSKIGLGWDVGYSPDPTVFFIMYQDGHGIWKNLMRLHLQRVEYALQRETLLWLDSVYNFDFMGIDMGGVGKVVYQELTSDLADAVYRSRNFAERLFPVEFGGKMVVALQENEENKNEMVERKDNIKRVAVQSLQRWIEQEKRFAFSDRDDELMDEIERTKLTRTSTGEPLYKTTDDHQFSAFMCAIMAYENRFGMPLMAPRVEIRPVLVSAHWLDYAND